MAIAQRASSPSGLLLVLACGIPAAFASSVWARASRIEPFGSYASAPPHATAVSVAIGAQEMVKALRDAGMPIAAIAEMARVERKTIYAWLEGSDARAERESRLVEIHNLLMGAKIDLRALWRVAVRPLGSGLTLRQLLSAEALNRPSIAAALDELRPAVERQARRETKRIPARPGAANPVLDEMAVADLG